MKTIEETVRRNRDLFEAGEPSEGHFERFSRKLEMRFGAVTPVKRSIVPYLLKAAVVTLLVTLSSLYTWDNFIRPESKRMALGDVSPEYREVENYYIHQVNLMENQISSVEFISDKEHKDVLMNEIESMDSVYVQLQKELKANPNDERIINAMIEHYQTKLEVMTFIINQLKAIRNENTNTTENEKVSI
jgi:cytochrome c-type biogenesis protein CcmH/NrfG